MRVIQIDRLDGRITRISGLTELYRPLKQYGVKWTAAVRFTDAPAAITWLCTFKKQDLAPGKLLVVKEFRSSGVYFWVEHD